MSESSAYDLRFYATRRQLAKLMGVSTRSIVRWELEYGLPSQQVLGHRRTYYLPTVVEWLKSRPNLARKYQEVQLT